MEPFGLVEPEGSGDSVEDVVGDAPDVAFLQARVPLGAHAGEHGYLLASKTGDTPSSAAGSKAGLVGGDLGPSGGQELADLGSVVHDVQATATHRS
jgi:hypothetical protein